MRYIGATMSGAEPEIRGTGAGARLRLRVRPGAPRDEIRGVHDGALVLAVTAAPERGKANRAVLGLLARRLGVPKNTLELVSGETSRDKVVLVPLPPDQVRSRLAGGPG